MERKEKNGGAVYNWSPQEVADAMAEGKIILIDVRTPQEFAFERIEGALLSPMQEFSAGYLPLEGERTVVLHCGSGVRSGKMADKLLAAGATQAHHLAGGFAAWKKAGLPYIETDMATGAPSRTKTK